MPFCGMSAHRWLHHLCAGISGLCFLFAIVMNTVPATIILESANPTCQEGVGVWLRNQNYGGSREVLCGEDIDLQTHCSQDSPTAKHNNCLIGANHSSSKCCTALASKCRSWQAVSILAVFTSIATVFFTHKSRFGILVIAINGLLFLVFIGVTSSLVDGDMYTEYPNLNTESTCGYNGLARSTEGTGRPSQSAAYGPGYIVAVVALLLCWLHALFYVLMRYTVDDDAGGVLSIQSDQFAEYEDEGDFDL